MFILTYGCPVQDYIQEPDYTVSSKDIRNINTYLKSDIYIYVCVRNNKNAHVLLDLTDIVISEGIFALFLNSSTSNNKNAYETINLIMVVAPCRLT